MPPIKGLDYSLREELLEKAVEDVYAQKYSSIAACARAKGVDKTALQRRVAGKASYFNRAPPGNRALNPAQEQAVCEFIELRSSFDIRCRLEVIRRCANSILKAAGETRVVSRDWPTRFVTRHPEFHKRKQKPLASIRKDIEWLELLARHEEFHKLRAEWGIPAEDVWNMDETGFRIGVGKTRWVISTHLVKSLVLADPDNRDYITSVECINGAGIAMAPLVILQGQLILDKWAFNDLHGDTLLAVSESGYSNDDIAFAWLKHFEIHSRKIMKGEYRLLILDGYGSYLTWEFWDFADKNKIILFWFVAHSTHLTQPLDVGCFQPMKHYHTEAIDRACRAGGTEFTKTDFLAASETIRRNTFKASTIRSVWQKTGLIPYNTDILKARFEGARSKTRQTTPPREDLPLFQRTPRGSKEVVRYAEWIFDRLKKRINSLIGTACFNSLRGSRLQLTISQLRLLSLQSLIGTAKRRQHVEVSLVR